MQTGSQEGQRTRESGFLGDSRYKAIKGAEVLNSATNQPGDLVQVPFAIMIHLKWLVHLYRFCDPSALVVLKYSLLSSTCPTPTQEEPHTEVFSHSLDWPQQELKHRQEHGARISAHWRPRLAYLCTLRLRTRVLSTFTGDWAGATQQKAPPAVDRTPEL